MAERMRDGATEIQLDPPVVPGFYVRREGLGADALFTLVAEDRADLGIDPSVAPSFYAGEGVPQDDPGNSETMFIDPGVVAEVRRAVRAGGGFDG